MSQLDSSAWQARRFTDKEMTKKKIEIDFHNDYDTSRPEVSE